MAVRQGSLKRASLGLLLGSMTFMASADEACLLYSPDPQHLWNRLHETLFVRSDGAGVRYGCDRIDPLYWKNTKHLLEPVSHRAAIRILGEFLATNGEQLAPSLLQRAFLQHDLWVLFDWTAGHSDGDGLEPQRAALRQRLAVAMRRLALEPAQIAALPDNVARTRLDDPEIALPDGLLQGDGPWVTVRAPKEAVAPVHMADFGGQSIFEVYVRLPDGREATLDYLGHLRTAALSSSDPVLLPGMPQFPVGTQWALVRRLEVIDSTGNLRPTPIVESVRLRTYVAIADAFLAALAGSPAQQFAEFIARRQDGLLRAVSQGEFDFVFLRFRSMGFDRIEYSVEQGSGIAWNPKTDDGLRHCLVCHTDPGIYSVRSLFPMAGFERRPSILRQAKPGHEAGVTAAWKRAQPDFGLLQGLWRSD